MATRSRRLGAGVAAALTVALVAGCGGGSEADSADNAGSGEKAAATGGTLRAAFAGGASETLNYLQGPTALDYVRAKLVHAPLCELDPQAEDGVSYRVLESIDVSDDLGEYTLKVRSGVKFSDGSDLTSKDVLYSLQAPTLLQGLPFTQLVSRGFDLKKASAPDASTVVLPTLAPIADGRDLICQSMLAIKDGTKEFTPETPSSGPFRITGFEAGRSTTLARSDSYYGQAPTLDAIELVSIADPTARVNALQQGQVDYISGIAPAQAQTLEGADGVSVTSSELPYASYLQFGMNPQTKPFDDERVREAFKLAVDRDRIVKNVYFGRAFVGNDVPGMGFPTYDTELEQRAHDPRKAQQLLAEAGAEGMEVELTAGPEMPGMLETATLIVEDLKAIGVKATLNELPAGQLFTDYPAYQKLPFKAGYNPPATFEPNYTPGTFPEVDALVATARSAPSKEDRLTASHEAQKLLWKEGSQIGAVFVPSISAAREGVSGVRELQFPDLAQATVSE
ncbi:ABC transporter substrate-binding protein [Kineosporia sp. NBRC 101731]|uniref:ABC transporter substrate-binding protein n=1 Tax=Kineosporia sp. NBRC 101731 TaxID=3032199 RepID=UPI0024A55649|nr:ABC transporter substrate-binding protein [Kineosporia sp. NBRC 101731]GLY32362.1 solute-binding protein [Kineosporia sp. NBRC 101731]